MITQPNIISREAFISLPADLQGKFATTFWNNVPIDVRICMLSVDLVNDKLKLDTAIARLRNQIESIPDSDQYHVSYIPSDEELKRLPEKIKNQFITDNDFDNEQKIRSIKYILFRVDLYPENIVSALVIAMEALKAE